MFVTAMGCKGLATWPVEYERFGTPSLSWSIPFSLPIWSNPFEQKGNYITHRGSNTRLEGGTLFKDTWACMDLNEETDIYRISICTVLD